jgi:Glycosyl hydrolase family 26
MTPLRIRHAATNIAALCLAAAGIAGTTLAGATTGVPYCQAGEHGTQRGCAPPARSAAKVTKRTNGNGQKAPNAGVKKRATTNIKGRTSVKRQPRKRPSLSGAVRLPSVPARALTPRTPQVPPSARTPTPIPTSTPSPPAPAPVAPTPGPPAGAAPTPPPTPSAPSPPAVTQTPPAGFPASYFNGPLGARNVVPGAPAGTLMGSAVGAVGMSWQDGWKLTLSREQAIGRQFDLYHLHYAAPAGKCWYDAPFSRVLNGKTLEQMVEEKGGTPVLSWHPGFTVTQAANGLADDCFRQFARLAKSHEGTVMLRMWWEFNIPGMHWGWPDSTYSDQGARSQAVQDMITAWRRVVAIVQAEGATNVGFFYCPDEGNQRRFAWDAYPGDAYVDWVGSDGYNWNDPNVYSTKTGTGWAEFGQIFHHTPADSMHDRLGPRKPFVIGETASALPDGGRHGDWLRNAGTYIRDRMPFVKGFLYFDVDVSPAEGAKTNYRLDSVSGGMAGLRDLGAMTHFNTRSR